MTLHELNMISQPELKEVLTNCCGSSVWVKMMMAYFPADDLVKLLEDAEEKWYECSKDDWKEAFAHHPKIGDLESLTKKFASTAEWASGEQSGVNKASEETIKALAEANKLYEEKFGYIFIVCATGKSAEKMFTDLQIRLQNNPEVEIETAAEEQNKITKIRLEKLLE
jgi:2-oxo-4-hydroxy-4-carboxy-5-ureidoimidazoline decarboxylase